MKKLYILFLLFSVFNVRLSAQGGVWTWISGSSSPNATGVYGTQGIPSVNNYPPANYEMVEWKDKQGNFWVFGGTSFSYADMWKFNPVTLEWTWMKGNGLQNVTPVYGTRGVADALNTPAGAYYGAETWVDTAGAFWLFGGSQTNDLWKYNPGTNEWTWVHGIHAKNGIHGLMGISNPANIPGLREEACSAWTDSLNNLWLFGGEGYDESGGYGELSDLMKYSISTNEWTWVKGSPYVNAVPIYGTKGVAANSNDPGGRWSYTKWKDKQGNFWLFGGGKYFYPRNDMWKYDPAANQWTWMNGSAVTYDRGKYGTTCVFDNAKNPGARIEQRSSVTDNCGRFWLFAGVNDNNDTYNDLWLYDPAVLQWKLLRGDSLTNPFGNYGTLGVPASTNIPPSRRGGDAWWGNDNRFYVFGGLDVVNRFNFSDVWVFTPDTSCVPSCVVAIAPPVADFTASEVSLCENDCITFTDLSTNASSWVWTFPGGLPPSSTDQNPLACYLTAGIYNVTLVCSNSGGSNSLTISNYINVSATPPAPVITQHNDTLVCSSDTSYKEYQWYKDTTFIAGATTNYLVITQSGNYNVGITNSIGCRISAGIVILGVQDYMNDHLITIYPNPAKDNLQLAISNQQFENCQLQIYNTMGQVVSKFEIRNSKFSLDVSSLSSGIYFVQLTNESGSRVGKFVKE